MKKHPPCISPLPTSTATSLSALHAINHAYGPAGAHLARGLEPLADPAHKLVRGADDEHIGSINGDREIRCGHDVFRQLRARQVSS